MAKPYSQDLRDRIEIRPGELVELDEVDAQGVHLENVLVHGLGDRRGAVAGALVEEIVRALRQHLNARVLDLGRLARSPLQRPRLLDHHGAAPANFVLDRPGVQTTVNWKAEMAALKIVHHAAQIMVDRRVGVIIAVDTTIRDDVEAGFLLVEGDSADGVLERFTAHGIRRFPPTAEMSRPGGVPPARVWIVTNHAGGNYDFLPTNFHASPPSFIPSGRLERLATCANCEIQAMLSAPRLGSWFFADRTS
jgi:hypothetical protein